MANCVKALQVSLQEDGFCIATGPHDAGILYPCSVKPFAPVLLNSPVVLHLYCPSLFPDEVLKVHAEHLGHFLALQSVPQINKSLERTLFLGLCELFTRQRVLSLYENTLTDEDLRREVLCVMAEKEEQNSNADVDDNDDQSLPMNQDLLDGIDKEASHPCVLVNFHKTKAGQIVSLLHKLLELFDLNELRDSDIAHIAGEEPQHMLFLYLIQLLAIFVSRCLEEKDLATILGLASAPFLEANFCNPLCAATLLKPMFIPYYDQQAGKKNRKGEPAGAEPKDPEARLKYYRLFLGYELDNKGSDVSNGVDISWTEHSVMQGIQGCKIAEMKSRKLWFVAPQMGDRMLMVKDCGLKMMGGQKDEKAQKICSCLLSDNVMAYMQCALVGAISNMLPCHANSDFTEAVMATIGSDMTKFSDVVRHQSANLMLQLSKMTDSCLYISGVGFAGQDKGNSLYFGKVFTGTEDKRPPQHQTTRLGVFTSVTLGLSQNTMMSSLLAIAMKQKHDQTGSTVQSTLSKVCKSVMVTKVAMDMSFYARYHHRFNAGEFTEVAQVKALSDPRYNSVIHEETLTSNSKYQLTVSLGALPMCSLTLAMSMRQAVMMTMGFLCAELARVIYAPKVNDSNLCKHLVSLTMAATFRHGKDEESTNAFEASYGNFLKLTGSAFSPPCRNGINFHELDDMEWLQGDDSSLPDYIHRSLNMIGDTKKEVRRIMQEKNVSYNRVLFMSENGVMKFSSVFANEEYMIHAPMMAASSMRIFSNNSNSYGSVKLCKQGSFYPVKVFSNRCVDTKLYSSQGFRNFSCLSEKTTIDDMVDRIKREVSCVMPRIDVARIKMMTPEFNEKDFGLLVSAVKNNDIEVTGLEESCISHWSSTATPHLIAAKRAGEEIEDGPEKKKAKGEGELFIYDTDTEDFD